MMPMQPEAITLANLAIQVLAAQKRYFKSRTRDDLIKAKELEAKLKTAAELVLSLGGGPTL